MPKARIPMKKIVEILRLKHEAKLSHEKIARVCQLSKGAVSKYVSLARARGVGWPLPEGVDEVALEALLFPAREKPSRFVQPDGFQIHQELKRKEVTLQLLWSEYVARHGERAYRYSRYCELYRQWRAQQKRSMRQQHRAGETLFVDYAGQTVPVVDPQSGEVHEAQVFIAVLGASNYTYAEATETQSLADWIASHVRAFEAFGGVPRVLVPDNLKAAVTRPHRYEPVLNRTYEALAQHYGVAVVPARAARPRDKAKVEVGVQVVERWILARLRHHTFFSFTDLNSAIRDLRADLNHRPFKKLPGSRQSLFESLERPALRPLPREPFEYAEWKLVRVNIDYHVDILGHYYSVPYTLVKAQLEARISARTVEVFHKGKRVASHPRSPHRGRHTTLKEHMPKAHRHYAEWTPQRLIGWASKTGGATAQVIEAILTARAYPQQGFRACLGIMRLGGRYGDARLEAACCRAMAIGACSYKSIESILKHNLDRQPLRDQPRLAPAIDHVNIRGPEYYL